MNKEEQVYSKGYRITDNGNIINPKGNQIAGCWYDGYNQITYRAGRSLRVCKVHRMQAFQKYGSLLYDDNIEVRHKNGDSRDNSYSNILIGTHSENMMDIPESIRMSKSLHAASFIRKYDKIEVREYHNTNGSSYKKTMNHFGISSKGTLHFILKK